MAKNGLKFNVTKHFNTKLLKILACTKFKNGKSVENVVGNVICEMQKFTPIKIEFSRPQIDASSRSPYLTGVNFPNLNM